MLITAHPKTGRQRRRLSFIAALSAMLLLTLSAAACSSSGSSSSASSGASSTAGTTTTSSKPLAGKTILVVPYWLDNFNTAYTSWLNRLLSAEGASVTVINANAVASRQLNAITSAIDTGKYDGIIWAPIDLGTADNTVNQIAKAGIPQVVFEGDLPSSVHVPQVNLDEQTSLTAAGVVAAQYIKSHPALGPAPLAAFMGVYPQNATCVLRMHSFLDGMRSVMPNAQVVYFGAANGESDAANKMGDFITSGKKFNVTDGCGSASTLGVLDALKSAGMANATDKTPQKVFIMTQDGTPPELQSLWNENSALMISSLLPPKTGAQETAALLTKVMTKQIPLDSTQNVEFGWTPITPNCAKWRPVVLDQFAGVPGFNVPACSFTYTGSS
jgi:ABC-type sugar transport system substrate-binding protein